MKYLAGCTWSLIVLFNSVFEGLRRSGDKPLVGYGSDERMPLIFPAFFFLALRQEEVGFFLPRRDSVQEAPKGLCDTMLFKFPPSLPSVLRPIENLSRELVNLSGNHSWSTP